MQLRQSRSHTRGVCDIRMRLHFCRFSFFLSAAGGIVIAASQDSMYRAFDSRARCYASVCI